MAKCIACKSTIEDGAHLCPECGTEQRTLQRRAKKSITVFSALSVILGVITIAISLFPQAYKYLFPKYDIDIYTVDASQLDKAERMEMTVVNKGNTDVFLTKVDFEPLDLEKYPMNGRTFVTNKWLKSGEAYLHLGRPITAINLRSEWSQITEASFLKATKWDGYAQHKYCFKIVPVDTEFGDVGRVPLKSKIPVKAVLYYSKSSGSTQVVKMVASKKLSGQIFDKESKQCTDWANKALQRISH